MWSYYGAKTNIVRLYPPPKQNKIIEPFCGTARYALKYFDHEVLLVDKYDVIVRIWKWLQQCSPNDILSLPRFKKGDNINDHTYDCEEARFLVGFTIGFGFTTPRTSATPRLRIRPNAQNYTLKRIAEQLWKIRHWEIQQGSYEEIPNQKATWFIDPPYQHGGWNYRHSGKKINYAHLAEWCRERQGQTIVCENTQADWMDFKPFTTQHVLTGKHHEAIWLNNRSHYVQQQQLFQD